MEKERAVEVAQEEERPQNQKKREDRVFDSSHWKKDKAAEDVWWHGQTRHVGRETGERDEEGECEHEDVPPPSDGRRKRFGI